MGNQSYSLPNEMVRDMSDGFLLFFLRLKEQFKESCFLEPMHTCVCLYVRSHVFVRVRTCVCVCARAPARRGVSVLQKYSTTIYVFSYMQAYGRSVGRFVNWSFGTHFAPEIWHACDVCDTHEFLVGCRKITKLCTFGCIPMLRSKALPSIHSETTTFSVWSQPVAVSNMLSDSVIR